MSTFDRSNLYPESEPTNEKEEKHISFWSMLTPSTKLVIAVAIIAIFFGVIAMAIQSRNPKPKNQPPLLTEEWQRYAMLKNDEYNLSEGEVDSILQWQRYAKDLRYGFNEYSLTYELSTPTRWTIWLTTPIETIELEYTYSDHYGEWQLWSMMWQYRFYYRNIQEEAQLVSTPLPDYEE